ncbi:hypothetical protein JTB14_012234 [Gonioctena quinquepunctata]|nr:hypothetical protein JTB14_012234 [Gonioctena quinquepunctata]
MPLTREQQNEIRNVADVVIKQLCKEQSFVNMLVEKVSAAVVALLNEKLNNLEKTVTDLKTEIVEIKSSHEKKITELEKHINDLGKKDGIFLHPTEIITELNEMRHREKNILIFGIPENEPNLDNFIQDAFSSVDPMMVMDSLHFSRIGRLPPNDPNKCRPVKVELPGTTHVLSLLKRNKKLQANRKYQDIYFRADQTVKQREHFLKTRQELNERERNGETNLVIKYKNGLPTICSKNA